MDWDENENTTSDVFFSKEQFDKRLERLSGNRNGSLSGRKVHLMSRFIRCPDCSRAYIAELQHGERKSGNYTYYKHQCKNNKTEYRIKEADLLSRIDRALESFRFSNSFRDNLKALFLPPLKRQKEKHRKEIQYFSERIAELNDRKMKLYDLFLDEEINKLDLVEKRRQYDEQIKILQRQRNSLEIDDKKVFNKIVEAIELIKEITDRYLSEKNPAEKIQLLKKMISDVALDQNGNLRLQWEKPYSLLMREEMEEAIIQNRTGILEAPCTTQMQGCSTLSTCVPRRGQRLNPISP